MKTPGKLEELPLASITLDKRLQMRPSLKQETIDRYAEVISEGVSMPAAVVFNDGKKNWLADGFQRFKACEKANCESLYCEVRKGTFRDAFLFALGANADHGVPRDNGTIEAVMKAAFADKELKQDSDRKLALLCNVSAMTVGRWRKKLTPKPKSGVTPVTPESRNGADGKTYTVQTPAAAAKSEPQWVETEEDTTPVLTAADWAEAETEKDTKGHARSYLKAAGKSLAALQDNLTQAARHGAKCDLNVVSQAARMVHAVIEQGGKSL